MTATLFDFADLIVSHTGATFLDNAEMRRKLTVCQDHLRNGSLLESVYAPFDYVERGAVLVIVGITPGASQAETGLSAARAALRRGLSIDQAAKIAKTQASFAGKGMRGNLTGMLDACGVPAWLGVSDSSAIFGHSSNLIHFTSALRNPVFVGDKNYNGQQPKILSNGMLKAIVEDTLAVEIGMLPDAYWLPLWDVPAGALQHLVSKGILRSDRLLPPLPHPSDQNRENISWIMGTNAKATFSKTRASTGGELLERKRKLIAFFADRRLGVRLG